MPNHTFDSVNWFMNEVGAHVVAETGIPSDRYHFGKMVLWSLKNDPDFVLQIDGATGQSETYKSALDRILRCAVALNAMGLKYGDVMVLMAPNHIDLCIPHYAALCLGIKVAAMDFHLGVQELCQMFEILKPNIIFSQSEKTNTIDSALELCHIKAHVVSFNTNDKHTTFAELIKDVDEKSIEAFKPANFNPEETIAYLTSTSGTTGFPKAASLTHKGLMVAVPYLWLGFSEFPTPTKLAIILSPLQWLSAGFHFLLSPILKFTRLQTSATITADHFAELVNKYRPTYTSTSPTQMTALTTVSDKCDFTCFEWVLLGGGAVAHELINEVKKLTGTENVIPVYGSSEVSGMAFYSDKSSPPNTLGRPIGCFAYRLVNHEANEDIEEPNVAGELWIRGPSIFKGYYNSPEATAEALTEDGWFKTGDIFYRDEHWNYFFVERLKSLLKYKNHQVAPMEIELLIRKHPGVLDVAVTGIPDRECGDLVVACVVRRPGHNPTALEIKELVKESLTDSKQLRGGVVFLDQLPTTSSAKIHRKLLKQMVMTMERE